MHTSQKRKHVHLPNFKVIAGQGSRPGGGKRTSNSLQEKQSAESVRKAVRPGPANLADPTFVRKCRNVTHLCFDLLFFYSRLAENH
jgi:hypothetical protein